MENKSEMIERTNSDNISSGGHRRLRHIAGRIGYVLFILITFLTVILYGVMRYLLDNWSELTMDELVFHMKSTLEGTNPDMIRDGLLRYGLPAALFAPELLDVPQCRGLGGVAHEIVAHAVGRAAHRCIRKPDIHLLCESRQHRVVYQTEIHQYTVGRIPFVGVTHLPDHNALYRLSHGVVVDSPPLVILPEHHILRLFGRQGA